MIIMFMLVSALCFFMAGRHYSLWDDHPDERNSLYWAITLIALGLYNMTSIVGYVKGLSCG